MKRAWAYALCVVLSAAGAGAAALPRARGQDAAKPAMPRARRHGHAHAAPAHEARPARTVSPRARARAERKKRRASEKAGPTAETRSVGNPPAKTEAGPSATDATAQAAQAAASGVSAQIVKEGDTSVKMMEFTGLGIDGRLKSPQLVYFVQRVRAEFERPVLPHRSFMPELEATTGREPIR
ncbi:MAG: hypothetical protein JWN04_390 [Myxococcaceae bacterium]|nr:hypothetical protein [Myxococcaceae bacterium]